MLAPVLTPMARLLRRRRQRSELDRILAALYGAGEQGIAVPDLTPGNGFLFQDSAGTTPVTAYEQPVGRIIDRSGRGNHIIQATSTKRPTLSARYNLLTYTEQFDNAAWTKANATVTANATTAPDGAMTADKLTANTTADVVHGINERSSSVTLSPGQTVFSVYAKAAGYNWVRLRVYNGAVDKDTWFDLANGVVGTVASDTTATILSVGNGWYRCTSTVAIGSTLTTIYASQIFPSPSNNTLTYTGDGTSGVFIWGADIRRTIDTIGQPAYQRVGASNDYDTAGFFPYLSFDGTDDSMATAASVDFTGTDKMTVFAGVTKLSDAARGMVVELTNNAANSFQLNAPSASLGDFSFLSRGSVLPPAVQASPFSAPFNAVVACAADIAAPSQQIRLNGTLRAQNSDTQGTGNYSNSTLFVGARNNNALFFNGRLYPFFIRGAATDAGLIAQVEQFLKARMPVASF